MKYFYLDSHSITCNSDPNKKPNGDFFHDAYLDYCHRNTTDFLFIANGEFYLIEYHACLMIDYKDKASWIQGVMDAKSKVKDYYSVESSWELSKEFKKERSLMLQRKKYIRQIHNVYSDNAGKKYCITTRTAFIDAIEIEETIRTNLESCIKYLNENGKEYLIEQASRLATENYIHVDDITIVKTIDEAIQTINKQIREV